MGSLYLKLEPIWPVYVPESCGVLPKPKLDDKSGKLVYLSGRPTLEGAVVYRTSSWKMDELFFFEDLFHCPCNATLVVAERQRPTFLFQFVAGISHQYRQTGELEHFDVIEIVADCHYFFARKASMRSPSLESVALGASLVENVKHAQIAVIVLRPKDCESIGKVAVYEHLLRCHHA